MRKLAMAIVIWLGFWAHPVQAQLGDPFVFTDDDENTMPYRLFTPPTAEGGGELPLVVFLHGSGERGTDNRLQVAVHISGLIRATQSEEFAAYLLAPQVPTNGNGWSADGQTDLGIEIIDSLTESLPIDTDRIYVTGLSMGGFGSFTYVAQHPDKFAAAVPMSGGFGPGIADRIKDIPIWSFHGDRDDVVIPQLSREMYDEVTNVGGTTHLTELVGGSHVIWSPIYGDTVRETYGLYDWMFSQRRNGRSPESLIEFGSEWAFRDDGSDQGEAWRAPEFDDSNWPRGAGPLGFGYDDLTTVLSCGPTEVCEDEKHATYYFRGEFNVDDPALIENVMAQIQRDDGVRVYVNGNEVFRDSNVRSTGGFDSFARIDALDNGLTAFRLDDAIVPGVNTLAVELHQASRGPADLRFDLRLTAVAVPEPSALMLMMLGLIGLAYNRHRRRSLQSGSVAC